jgi:putative endonuclease
MDPRTVLGRYGEDLAAAHLMSLGMKILARNWRCPAGEIDIVARDGDTLVVCEVKTRRSDSFGVPAAAVSPAKARRQRALATAWLAGQGDGAVAVRFDVIGILAPTGRPPTLEHLRAVIG